jgi:exodeoxyribonuclease VII large subunit
MFSSSSYPERVGAPVLSVSGFLLQIRRVIEAAIPLGWVSGEVSNLVRAGSGHLYFTLKDERAQVRCTMWRNRAQLLPFQLCEGMHVEVRAQATLYEVRGDLQLTVDGIRRAGQGNLYEAFLRLKARLEGEGLFDSARKRALPDLPRGLGIVTSPAAAALRDILATLARRAPGLAITLYPTQVQGEGVGEQVAAAIRVAGERAAADGVDLLIVSRGGGSIEDLWAFNHEAVVRAIAASPIPVISGVGHETDTTLADFAADLRAATPTAAAEVASAGWFAQREGLALRAGALQRAWLHYFRQATQHIDEMQRRLSHPRVRLARSAEKLENLQQRMRRAVQSKLQVKQGNVAALTALLAAHAPRLEPLRARLAVCEQSLVRNMGWRQNLLQSRLDGLGARLAGLNPEAVLSRGYAIVRGADGRIVRDAQAVVEDESLDIQLAHSRLKAKALRQK